MQFCNNSTLSPAFTLPLSSKRPNCQSETTELATRSNRADSVLHTDYSPLKFIFLAAVKDEDGDSIEVWYARELQELLGYARWENFVTAVGRAIESRKTL